MRAPSIDDEVTDVLTRARDQCPNLRVTRAVSWRGLEAVRLASHAVNVHAFGRAAAILLRAVRASGHGSSDDFARTASSDEEAAVFARAIDAARARAAADPDRSSAPLERGRC